VKIIPGSCENPFPFPPESLFTISPELCSSSSRNTFHVRPGIPFTFPRNPHEERYALLSRRLGTGADGFGNDLKAWTPDPRSFRITDFGALLDSSF
jgi:hypothetical protein